MENQGENKTQHKKSGQKILYWQHCGYVICEDAGSFFFFKYVEAWSDMYGLHESDWLETLPHSF